MSISSRVNKWKMIRKILTLTLCLILSSCVGFNSATGLKFNTGDDRVVELKNGRSIIFERPIGNCGVRITFFGIILPIIPIWFNSNSCEKSLDIDFAGGIGIPELGLKAVIKLKYNGTVHDPIALEKLTMLYGINGEHKSEYGRKFKFKIDDFKNFKEAEDKAIIISGKIDGKKFTEELPVKWGLMLYKNPSIPW